VRACKIAWVVATPPKYTSASTAVVKEGAVVVIGVDRREIGRDNGAR
jgi:ABC-type uncharacterized transport system substrate-binding protein